MLRLVALPIMILLGLLTFVYIAVVSTGLTVRKHFFIGQDRQAE